MELHHTAMECHLLYRITQRYLPPDTSEHTPPSPQPDRMEGWVSQGRGCKEQLAHGYYATDSPRSTILEPRPHDRKSSMLTTRLLRQLFEYCWEPVSSVQVFDRQPHCGFGDGSGSRKYSDVRVTGLDSEETRINISSDGVQNCKRNLSTDAESELTNAWTVTDWLHICDCLLFTVQCCHGALLGMQNLSAMKTFLKLKLKYEDVTSVWL